jgi:hypothetical protein
VFLSLSPSVYDSFPLSSERDGKGHRKRRESQIERVRDR